MNSEKAISIFGLAMGIGLFIFGIIGASGALSFIEPKRTWLIFFFAILLIIWHWLSFKSLKKAEQNKNTVEAISGGQPAGSPVDITDAKAGGSPAETGETEGAAAEISEAKCATAETGEAESAAAPDVAEEADTETAPGPGKSGSAPASEDELHEGPEA